MQSVVIHDVVRLEEEQEGIRDETENLTRYSLQQYWDATAQEKLPPDFTIAARKEELGVTRDWEVWDNVPVSESWAVAGKASLLGKWVEANKGDLERAVIRSLYVAKEFANTSSDEFFAATPPLEALRMLFVACGLEPLIRQRWSQGAGCPCPEGVPACPR